MAAPVAVILAGGLGTRIRHLLPDLPKPLAPAAGRPFLEWVLRYLRGQGLTRFLLATGHHADRVETFVGELGIPGVTVECVQERSPLGTAGGFLNAVRGESAKTDAFLVCNGDSLALADLGPLFAAIEHADAAILAAAVPDATRYGTVDVGPDGRLRGFAEKRPGAGLVNAGVYLFRRSCVGRFPGKLPLSFEYDVFPALLAAGARIDVARCEAPFLDIGTEASLAQADRFIRDNMRWFQ
jgi:D-glycero-alpha-D-manno-heptose 1-phosphate guanylyltransferase